jgi:hypothetical protein
MSLHNLETMHYSNKHCTHQPAVYIMGARMHKQFLLREDIF